MTRPQSPPTAPWRIGRGWTEPERRAHLAALAGRAASRAAEHTTSAASSQPGGVLPPGLTGSHESAAPWTEKRVLALLGREPPGPPLPDGSFARIAQAIRAYRFADPRITRGTFDLAAPLLGRDMLVEARALLVYLLLGLRIGAVIDESDATTTCFGIRMDTLEGHILDGTEWIEVSKDHQSGAVTAAITARWRPSRLPTWWLAFGFRLFGPSTQARWRRQALRRLRAIGA